MEQFSVTHFIELLKLLGREGRDLRDGGSSILDESWVISFSFCIPKFLNLKILLVSWIKRPIWPLTLIWMFLEVIKCRRLLWYNFWMPHTTDSCLFSSFNVHYLSSPTLLSKADEGYYRLKKNSRYSSLEFCRDSWAYDVLNDQFFLDCELKSYMLSFSWAFSAQKTVMDSLYTNSVQSRWNVLSVDFLTDLTSTSFHRRGGETAAFNHLIICFSVVILSEYSHHMSFHNMMSAL